MWCNFWPPREPAIQTHLWKQNTHIKIKIETIKPLHTVPSWCGLPDYSWNIVKVDVPAKQPVCLWVSVLEIPHLVGWLNQVEPSCIIFSGWLWDSLDKTGIENQWTQTMILLAVGAHYKPWKIWIQQNMREEESVSSWFLFFSWAVTSVFSQLWAVVHTFRSNGDQAFILRSKWWLISLGIYGR